MRANAPIYSFAQIAVAAQNLISGRIVIIAKPLVEPTARHRLPPIASQSRPVFSPIIIWVVNTQHVRVPLATAGTDTPVVLQNLLLEFRRPSPSFLSAIPHGKVRSCRFEILEPVAVVAKDLVARRKLSVNKPLHEFACPHPTLADILNVIHG
jgi:hypothetical protein